MQEKIKVLIVDDHNLITKLLDTMFQSTNDIEVVGTLHDGSEVLDFIQKNEIDVMLLDIDMPEKDGIETLKELKKIKNYPKTIMLTNHQKPAYIKRALNNGAIGYITKFAKPEEITRAVRNAYLSKKTFSSDIMNNGLLDQAKEYDDTIFEKLTDREKNIIQLICCGRTTREIAEKLHISPRTVETHRKNILHKLNVKNVAELINLIQSIDLPVHSR